MTSACLRTLEHDIRERWMPTLNARRGGRERGRARRWSEEMVEGERAGE
jgi:hypothetical protein